MLKFKLKTFKKISNKDVKSYSLWVKTLKLDAERLFVKLI